MFLNLEIIIVLIQVFNGSTLRYVPIERKPLKPMAPKQLEPVNNFLKIPLKDRIPAKPDIHKVSYDSRFNIKPPNTIQKHYLDVSKVFSPSQQTLTNNHKSRKSPETKTLEDTYQNIIPQYFDNEVRDVPEPKVKGVINIIDYTNYNMNRKDVQVITERTLFQDPAIETADTNSEINPQSFIQIHEPIIRDSESKYQNLEIIKGNEIITEKYSLGQNLYIDGNQRFKNAPLVREAKKLKDDDVLYKIRYIHTDKLKPNAIHQSSDMIENHSEIYKFVNLNSMYVEDNYDDTRDLHNFNFGSQPKNNLNIKKIQRYKVSDPQIQGNLMESVDYTDTQLPLNQYLEQKNVQIRLNQLPLKVITSDGSDISNTFNTYYNQAQTQIPSETMQIQQVNKNMKYSEQNAAIIMDNGQLRGNIPYKPLKPLKVPKKLRALELTTDIISSTTNSSTTTNTTKTSLENNELNEGTEIDTDEEEQNYLENEDGRDPSENGFRPDQPPGPPPFQKLQNKPQLSSAKQSDDEIFYLLPYYYYYPFTNYPYG